MDKSIFPMKPKAKIIPTDIGIVLYPILGQLAPFLHAARDAINNRRTKLMIFAKVISPLLCIYFESSLVTRFSYYADFFYTASI